MEPLGGLLDMSFSLFFLNFIIFRGISLKEDLDIAFKENESYNDVSAVYIEFSDSNILTYEDSTDDAGFIYNLNRNQIPLDAEIVFLDTRIGGTAEVTIIEETT